MAKTSWNRQSNSAFQEHGLPLLRHVRTIAFDAQIGMKRRLAHSDSDSDDDADDDLNDTLGADDDDDAAVAPAKLQRYTVDTSAASDSHLPSIRCSLPPTCSIRPQTFPTQAALSAHYNTHHAHICQDQGCGKIFPDNHFLDLHLRELHDPLVAVQRENGKKTVRRWLQ